jgi:hypothetical protein
MGSDRSRKPDNSGRNWCSGKIYFTDGGCLYIEDSTLARAIDDAVQARQAAGKQGMCISYQDPNSPSNTVNVLCAC